MPKRNHTPPLGRAASCLILLALWGCPERPLEQARSLQAAGKHLEAGDAFLDAAKASPGDLAAWDGAVSSFCEHDVRVGRCLEALDLELKLLGNLDRHVHVASAALDLRARARLDQGMVQAALSDIERAQRLGPAQPAILVTLARIRLAQGSQDAAVELLVRAKKLQPDHAEAETLLRELADADSPATEPAFGGAPHSP